ncbi:hypothetical protein ACFLWS_03435 [Chloroflexota bacterium]
MSEMGETLVSMSDGTFAFHGNAEKNDFTNRVRDIIKDGKLARGLMNSNNRTQAAEKVADRVAFLKDILTFTSQKSPVTYPGSYVYLLS